MKKISTITLVVLLYTNYASAQLDTLLHQTFAGGIPAGWSNSGTSSGSANPWVKWRYTTTGAHDAYNNGDTMNSPTASNGYIIFDSDSLDNGAVAGRYGQGPAPAPQVVALTTTAIPLNGNSHCRLSFSQYFRNLQSTTVIGVSVDSINWTLDTVNAAIGIGESTDNGERITVDLSPVILAAGAPYNKVYISFQMNAYYYFWMIDDILFTSLPDYELQIDSTYGGKGTSGLFYSSIPASQFTASDSFSVATNVLNAGLNTQTTITSTYTLSKGTASLYSLPGSPAIASLAYGQDTSVHSAAQFGVSGIGNYALAVNISSPDSANFDHGNRDSIFFNVSDSVFSINSSLLQGQVASYLFNSSQGIYFKTGGLFEVTHADTVTSVTTAIQGGSGATPIGSVIQASIYSVTLTGLNVNYNTSSPQIKTLATTVTAGDLTAYSDANVTPVTMLMDFNTGNAILQPGTYWVAIGSLSSPPDSNVVICSTADCQPGGLAATDGNGVFGTYNTYLPYCNLNFGHASSLVTFSAGPDQSVCTDSTATMAGSGSGTWQAVAGNPSAISFGNSTAPNTTVTGLSSPGTYRLVYTNGSVYDTASITVRNCVDTTPSFFSPSDSVFSCIQNGVAFSDTLHFTAFDSVTFQGQAWAMDSMKFDSIYLPTGLIWSTNSATNTFYPGQSGAIYINGTAADSVGQYKLRIIVTMVVNVFGGPVTQANLDFEQNFGTAYRVRVICPGHYCPVIDNSSADSARTFIPYTPCGADTLVWPGDADNNGIVDNNDLLPIGLGYDSAGHARTIQSIVWQGDVCTDWSYDFSNYTPALNYKYADCNGDGIINANDSMAIVQNFSLTHNKTTELPGPWRSGNPGFYLSFSQDTLTNGAQLVTTISLGNSSLPASNIYGLAFTLNYDPIVNDAATASFSFTPSWLSTAGHTISIAKNIDASGAVKVAVTGINRQARSGYGPIATFTSTISTIGLNANNPGYYQNLYSITGITAIDANGNVHPLNSSIDTIYVHYFPTGVSDINGEANITLFPNPAADLVNIKSSIGMTRVSISDMPGKAIREISLDNKLNESLDISGLDAGVYIVHISTKNGTVSAKLVVSR